MKGKEKLNQIYHLDVYFPLLQGQGKDLPDVEMTSILPTLKTRNPYLTVFTIILQIILKMHSIIYEKNLFCLITST